MSEFDKEAERRRLREKYESEAEDRETTERMSQLLLQGATMTNQHCDHCGTPIFRYQGQEFCPTCQAESQAAADADTDTTGSAPEQQADVPEQNAATATEAPTPRQDTTPSVPQREETTLQAGDETTGQLPEVAAGDGPTEALASTIATLAARAEQTDDPRRAREFLEAAHEAAETLATLRR